MKAGQGAPGTVEIVARTVDQVPPPYVGGSEQAWMAIEVRDNGVGMDAAARERIFEPFFTTKQTGSGIGLAITRNIVEGLGGRVDVESRIGEGTTVRFVLPR